MTGSAVCSEHEMRRGRHYAAFTLGQLDGGDTMLGVVGQNFDPTATAAAHHKAHRSPWGWVMYANNGLLFHANHTFGWEGKPRYDELKEGDVVVRPPLRP